MFCWFIIYCGAPGIYGVCLGAPGIPAAIPPGAAGIPGCGIPGYGIPP